MRAIPLPSFALAIITAVLVTVALVPPASAAAPPVNGKYRTYAYIAATRQGSAVYINGLVKQDYSTGLIRSHGRTIWLQRNLNGTWQTMLSRVTDWYGKFTVGFVSGVSYQYRYLVTASGSAWGTTSGIATPPSTPTSCTPGYSPCIPPGPDVDCAGGSGDGPRYVQGPVRVTGNDPYRLDADHDGIGCE
jgi:hypothetical protein